MTGGDAEHNLWTVFDAVARATGPREAIVAGATRRSYAEVAARARAFARFLSARGIGCHQAGDELEPWELGQDVVALYLLNGAEYLEATLGAYGARAVPVNVNYRYGTEELVHILDDSSSAAVVFHRRFAATLSAALPRLHRSPLLLQVDDGSAAPLLPGAVAFESVLRNTGDGPLEPVGGPHRPDDRYALFTGGTTGMPKGTLWRHADIFDAALGGRLVGLDVPAIATAAATKEPAAVVPLAPFMHGAAQWTALAALFAGDTVVINDVVDHLDPADVWSVVQRERAERMLIVGEAFARPLLEELEVGDYDVASLRLIVIGGAVTSPETKARLLRLVPSAHVADVAGASETGQLLSAVSAPGRVTEAGVFRPGPTTVVLDADRRRVLVPGHDGIGWVAKSGAIPLGYLGDRAKTEATFPSLDDGTRYVVPGDRATLRADGLIELLGRDSVTINSAGEKIFAEEIEQAVLRVPQVRDAIVCGRPSERWGQEVVAIVTYAPGQRLTDRELLDAITGIARFKLPKAVVEVDEVRRSPAGKADYAWASKVAVTGDVGST